jgi:hypothetical protein
MSDDVIIEKLEKIFYECDKHLSRVQSSAKELEQIMPLSADTYINLSEESIMVLDQFLFRFSKLQDAMGQKLFKMILLYLNEDIEGKPFIDILNRMEKLHLLEDANEWKLLREDRNELAHNYEDEPKEMSLTINKLYKKRIVLQDIYLHIKDFYQNFN